MVLPRETPPPCRSPGERTAGPGWRNPPLVLRKRSHPPREESKHKIMTGKKAFRKGRRPAETRLAEVWKYALISSVADPDPVPF